MNPIAIFERGCKPIQRSPSLLTVGFSSYRVSYDSHLNYTTFWPYHLIRSNLLIGLWLQWHLNHTSFSLSGYQTEATRHDLITQIRFDVIHIINMDNIPFCSCLNFLELLCVINSVSFADEIKAYCIYVHSGYIHISNIFSWFCLQSKNTPRKFYTIYFVYLLCFQF